MSVKNYTVEGMTCGHCEMSVREEVGEIAGVSSVSADHTTGAVAVEGEGFTDEQVVAAVAEAGYKVKA
ncbi:heavy-metal-associated domain-containing protein [Corynebacterium simulans]